MPGTPLPEAESLGFKLFGFPIELRLMIWSYAFGDNSLRLQLPRPISGSVYAVRRSAHPGIGLKDQKLPRWLLINKQIYNEAAKSLKMDYHICASTKTHWGVTVQPDIKNKFIIPTISTSLLGAISSGIFGDSKNGQIQRLSRTDRCTQLDFRDASEKYMFILFPCSAEVVDELQKEGVKIKEAHIFRRINDERCQSRFDKLVENLKNGSTYTTIFIGKEDWRVDIIEEDDVFGDISEAFGMHDVSLRPICMRWRRIVSNDN